MTSARGRRTVARQPTPPEPLFDAGAIAIATTGRLLAIADAFDAMTSPRSYQQARPLPEALREIESQSGRQFDPALAAIFLAAVRRGRISLLPRN